MMNKCELLPAIFMVYSVMAGLLGTGCLSAIITVLGLIVLEKKKLKQASPETVQNVLESHKCSIIAHRGAAHDSPENTLAAIKKSKECGADGVEFDIEFTKDGQAVVLHDDTIDRTTDGRGRVGDYTLSELKNFSASCKHPKGKEFGDEKIPTLEEVVNLCLELKLKMYLDVKGNAAKASGSIIALFKKYPEMYNNAAVCSFYPQVVYLIKKADERIVTGLTHRHRVLTRKVDGTERSGAWYKQLIYPVCDVALEWSVHAWMWYLCGTNAVLLFNQDVSRQLVEKYEKRNIQVIVWTPNTNMEKNYIHNVLKCSYMTDTLFSTDCPAQSN